MPDRKDSVVVCANCGWAEDYDDYTESEAVDEGTCPECNGPLVYGVFQDDAGIFANEFAGEYIDFEFDGDLDSNL